MQFTDSKNRTWTVEITFDAIRRVRAELDINLANIVDGEPPLLATLQSDPILLIDTICAIVKPQLDEAGVTTEQFGQALGGKAIADANAAFWKALADFFREAGETAKSKAIEKQLEIVQQAMSQMEREINALDPPQLIPDQPGNRSSNWPAS